MATPEEYLRKAVEAARKVRLAVSEQARKLREGGSAAGRIPGKAPPPGPKPPRG